MGCINKIIKSRKFGISLFVCPLILFLLFGGCSVSEKSAATDIIAGTSLIADIIADLTDASVSTYTLLPSSSCPSQFDLKTSDISRLEQAQLIFLHPWQLKLANIRRVLDAAEVPESRIHVVEVPGNWMLPGVQTAAAVALSETLRDLYPEQRGIIAERAERRIARIHKIEDRERETLPPSAISDIAVLCNEMQAPFIRWLGFDVVEGYARSEDWSVSEMKRLVQLGNERKIMLVIDNLQNGSLRMSETLARNTNAVSIVLSNFPNGFPNTPTWEAAFTENMNRLRKSLAHSVAP
ncbi:MAG: zinc ABC transporter substrate-binding protein [Candidatus Hydrogenedentes bacterium]|nr:zinc ABC transporter substrate-binding protein [Candidatus Hydrogenedentota bacterium]